MIKLLSSDPHYPKIEILQAQLCQALNPDCVFNYRKNFMLPELEHNLYIDELKTELEKELELAHAFPGRTEWN